MKLKDDTLAHVAATLTAAMIGRHAGKPMVQASPEGQIAVTMSFFDDFYTALREKYGKDFDAIDEVIDSGKSRLRFERDRE